MTPAASARSGRLLRPEGSAGTSSASRSRLGTPLTRAKLTTDAVPAARGRRPGRQADEEGPLTPASRHARRFAGTSWGTMVGRLSIEDPGSGSRAALDPGCAPSADPRLRHRQGPTLCVLAARDPWRAMPPPCCPLTRSEKGSMVLIAFPLARGNASRGSHLVTQSITAGPR